MSNPIYPPSLPSSPLVEAYKRTFSPAVVRTPMEIGPAKQRQRFTAVTQPLNCIIEVDRPQLVTFKFFYRETLGYGALPFDHIDPETLDPVTFQFIGDQPPSWHPLSGAQIWAIALNLEILP